jgi:hypothetical protein
MEPPEPSGIMVNCSWLPPSVLMELFTLLSVLHWDGTAQDVTVTARLAAGDVPQAFVGVTETVPLADPAVAVMEVVVEVPVQPGGSVQV